MSSTSPAKLVAMSRRRFMIAGAVLSTILLAGIAFQFLRPGSAINRQNFERIQVGMALSEVEDIVGLPAGDYSTGNVFLVEPARRFSLQPRREWWGDEGILQVRLDAEGRVTEKHFLAVYHSGGNSLSWLRRKLGL